MVAAIKSFWKQYPLERNVLLVGIALLLLPLTMPHYWGTTWNDPQAGQLGDFVGGYLGTVLSLVSVVLLVITFRGQKRSFQEEKFETAFLDLLKLHRDNVQEIAIGSEGVTGRRAFVLMVRELRAVLEKVHAVNKAGSYDLGKERLMDAAYLAFFYGVGPNSSRVLAASLREFPQTFTEELLRCLDSDEAKAALREKLKYTPYEGHQSRLSHYFRHLYNAVMYVHRSDLSIIKKDHVRLIRAQLSTHEQALLYFNSLSRVGRKWITEGLILDYELIKHIPPEFFHPELELDPKVVFPSLKFEWEL